MSNIVCVCYFSRNQTIKLKKSFWPENKIQNVSCDVFQSPTKNHQMRKNWDIKKNHVFNYWKLQKTNIKIYFIIQIKMFILCYFSHFNFLHCTNVISLKCLTIQILLHSVFNSSYYLSRFILKCLKCFSCFLFFDKLFGWNFHQYESDFYIINNFMLLLGPIIINYWCLQLICLIRFNDIFSFEAP